MRVYLKLPSPKSPARRTLAGLAIALSTSTVGSATQAFELNIPLKRINNYAECVIHQIQPDTGSLKIKAIEDKQGKGKSIDDTN